MSTPTPTRRSLLRRTSAALLAAGATAGCAESLPPLGQRVQYGRVDVPAPESADPTYRRWLPAASALPGDDLDPGFVNFATPGDLGDKVVGRDNLEAHFFQKPYLDYFGHGYERFDRVVGMHRMASTYVLEGDVDRETVRSTLVGSGYDSEAPYEGYDRFHRDDGARSRTALVGDDAVVWANHAESRALVEAVVDAERGAVPRHHETDESFALATDAVGARPWLHVGGLGVDPTGEAEVTSLSYAFDADGCYYLYHTVYPAGGTPSERAVRDALEEHSRGLDAWAVEVSVADRVSTVEMRQSHDEVPADYGDVVVPQITWDVERDGDAVTVRHEAGESTPAETTTLYLDGPEGRTATATQFADDRDRIRPGDEVTVRIPADATAERLVGEFSPAGFARAAEYPIYVFP